MWAESHKRTSQQEWGAITLIGTNGGQFQFATKAILATQFLFPFKEGHLRKDL